MNNKNNDDKMIKLLAYECKKSYPQYILAKSKEDNLKISFEKENDSNDYKSCLSFQISYCSLEKECFELLLSKQIEIPEEDFLKEKILLLDEELTRLKEVKENL